MWWLVEYPLLLLFPGKNTDSYEILHAHCVWLTCRKAKEMCHHQDDGNAVLSWGWLIVLNIIASSRFTGRLPSCISSAEHRPGPAPHFPNMSYSSSYSISFSNVRNLCMHNSLLLCIGNKYKSWEKNLSKNIPVSDKLFCVGVCSYMCMCMFASDWALNCASYRM